MSKELVCPFCRQELRITSYYDTEIHGCYCDKCGIFGDLKLWQELIRTRNALDGAKKALNDIQFTDDGNRIVDIRSFAHHALEQITALEQKDVKC